MTHLDLQKHTARRLGIIDELLPANADLHDAAISYTMRLMDVRPFPRVRDRTVVLEDPGLFDATRRSIARRARNQTAPYHCIAAVEASCSLPFDEGCRREADLFKELEDSAEARALRCARCSIRSRRAMPLSGSATSATRRPRTSTASRISADPIHRS